MNFLLKQDHGWALEELDNMMPWEREIYIALLKDHVEEEEKNRKKYIGN